MRACDVRIVAGDVRRPAQLELLRAVLRGSAVSLTGAEVDAPYAGLAAVAGNAEGGRPDDPFLIQFSSGSTGGAKGIVRSQRNLCAEADNFSETTGVTADDAIFCAVPMFHAHGLGNCLLAAVRAAAKLVILEPASCPDGTGELPFAARCERVFQLVIQERVTVLPGVPHMFSALAELPRGMAEADSLRLCFSAGNHLSRTTFERFRERFGLSIRQLYGCTEAGSVTMNMDADPAVTSDSLGALCVGPVSAW